MIQLQKTLKTFAQRRETRRARMCSTLRDARKKTLSSHNVVDSHPLHLLPMIYRSRYTNFISSFSPEVMPYLSKQRVSSIRWSGVMIMK